MEYQKLQIVNIKQNIYEYNVFKTKIIKSNRKMFSSIFLFVVVFFAYCCLNNISYMNVNNIVDTATYIYKPTNPLYFDMGNIVFTNGLNKIVLKEKTFKFNPIVNYVNYQISENFIDFFVEENISLYAPESGVVSDIYIESNNIKCVKIKHSKSTYSIIKNVNILGVHLGALVKQNQMIGTVKNNTYVKMLIEVNGRSQNLSFDGKIICVN